MTIDRAETGSSRPSAWDDRSRTDEAGQGKEKGATHMEMNERKEFIIKNIAEKFVEMDDADKSYIAGL